MNNNEFCHLHVHDQYSLLDGFGTAEQYLERANELGFTRIALTNHGNADGVVKWQQECNKVNITPIVGCEAYIVPNLLDKDKEKEKRFHITLLVKNQTGWRNLLRMLTQANLNGFYYRPRIDPELLLQHCDGIAIMTACILTFLNMPNGEELLKNLSEKTNVFGEIMPLQMPEQHDTNNLVLKMSNKYNLKIVATNDCHYPLAEHNKLQEVLLAMQRKDRWNNPNRWKFSVDDLYLKTADEMLFSFEKQNCLDRKTYQKAIENTMEVAELCNFKLESRKPNLPKVHIEKYPNLDEDEQLIMLTMDGLKKRAEDHEWIKKDIKKYEERIEEELTHIIPNFTRYFLIVWELIDWCNRNNIFVGPGRGSSAGSLVAYCLGITRVDSIKYDLIFSRFISPGRIDLPDIDMDFEDRHRDKVKQHLADIYGKWNVIEVSTFLKMHGRGALRDVGRVFDIPLFEVDKAAKAIVVRSGGDFRCLSEDSEVWTINGPIKIKELFVNHDNIRVYSIHGNRVITKNIKDVYHNGMQECFEIEMNSGEKIIATENHVFWTQRGWVKLKELNINTDKLYSKNHDSIYTKCANCSKYIKAGRKTCSLSCTTTYRNKTNNPMSNFKVREKMKITKKGQRCKWHDDPDKISSFKGKMSKRMTENNPMSSAKTRNKLSASLRKVMPNINNRPEKVEKQRQYMLNRLEEKPESHPLRLISKLPRKGVCVQTKWQSCMQNMVEEIFSEFQVESEFKIKKILYESRTKKRGWYYLDVAIPKLKINFEYDSSLHKLKVESDAKRDKFLKDNGWKVIRISKRDMYNIEEARQKILEAYNAI